MGVLLRRERPAHLVGLPDAAARLADPELEVALLVGPQPERVDVEAARAFRIARRDGDEVEFRDHAAELSVLAPHTERMPTPVIIDCDPGHDDAIALLLALASPEVTLLGVTTVHGNQTLEKTTANAIRVLDLAGRADVAVAAGAERPLVRELTVASHVHGDSGLDGPALPPPGRAAGGEGAVDFMARAIAASPEPVTLVPTGPLTNVAQLLARTGGANVGRIVLMGGAIAEGNMTPAAEFNIWADPEAAQAVFRCRPRHDHDRARRDAPRGHDACAAGATARHRDERRVRGRPRRVLHRLPP